MNKPFKNGLYVSDLEKMAQKHLPKTNKYYHNKNTDKIHITGLKPNRCIFYFATNHRDFTKSIQERIKAYGKLENSGVTSTDLKGDALIHINCPQLYLNDDGEVHPRHFHFIYWDNKNECWDKNLYTNRLLCKVNNKFLIEHSKKSFFICPEHMCTHSLNHNMICMEYSKRWNVEKVIELLKTHNKKYDGDLLTPIIICCKKDETHAHKLYEKLNKLGFHNTVCHL
jgi:hypothetical protein